MQRGHNGSTGENCIRPMSVSHDSMARKGLCYMFIWGRPRSSVTVLKMLKLKSFFHCMNGFYINLEFLYYFFIIKFGNVEVLVGFPLCLYYPWVVVLCFCVFIAKARVQCYIVVVTESWWSPFDARMTSNFFSSVEKLLFYWCVIWNFIDVWFSIVTKLENG